MRRIVMFTKRNKKHIERIARESKGINKENGEEKEVQLETGKKELAQ